MYWKKYLSLQENVKYLATSPIRNIQDIYRKTNENLLKPIKEYQIILKINSCTQYLSMEKFSTVDP